VVDPVHWEEDPVIKAERRRQRVILLENTTKKIIQNATTFFTR